MRHDVRQGSGGHRSAVIAARQNGRRVDAEAQPGAPIRLDFIGYIEVLAGLQPGLTIRAVQAIDRFLDFQPGERAPRDTPNPAVQLDDDGPVRLQTDAGCAELIGPGV